MTAERYFPYATVEQIDEAARACRRAIEGGDDDWDSDLAEDARRLTDQIGWSWDFESWSHAAAILEEKADLARE